MTQRSSDLASGKPTEIGVIDADGVDRLIAELKARGYTVIGPRRQDGAIIFGEVHSAADLPAGYSDEQDAGRYRLADLENGALFQHVNGPHTWKRYLFPADQTLWRARRNGASFDLDPPEPQPRFAFLGVRACDLHSLAILDRVFADGDFADPIYTARRTDAFIAAVDCAHPSGTCFCTSMDTGPSCDDGFDLCLTELADQDTQQFLVAAGSADGKDIASSLSSRPAEPADLAAAEATRTASASQMGRAMIPDVADLLRRNLENPHWENVAQRCLSCANCTMVCPTCFCSTTEDATDLSGDVAERTRHWDSCFNLDFSYIHGGSIRRETSSRYRQWITHKLSYWHDQFGTSGCVGCGRCITWCPVGIDITAEASLLADAERGDR